MPKIKLTAAERKAGVDLRDVMRGGPQIAKPAKPREPKTKKVMVAMRIEARMEVEITATQLKRLEAGEAFDAVVDESELFNRIGAECEDPEYEWEEISAKKSKK